MKKKKWPIVVVAILAIWGIGSIIRSGSSGDNSQPVSSDSAEPTAAPAEQPEEVLEVTVADLLAAYAENEISADAAHTGKFRLF